MIIKYNIVYYNDINLKKIPCINDFIEFYYEIITIKGKNDLDYFPFYEPLTKKCYFYLSIKKTDCKNEDIAVLVVDPALNFENITLKLYENNFTYILIVFNEYLLDLNEEQCKLFSKFFLILINVILLF